MESKHKKEKTITIKLILGWTVGLFFILIGTIVVFNVHILGIFMILAALVVFPPFMQFIKNKTGVTLSVVLRIVLFLVLLGMGVGFEPSLDKTDNSKNSQTTVVPSTAIPTPMVVDMSVFIGEYGKNKIGAQDKYTGKRVQFTAFIDNITSDVLGKYYLSLNPTNDNYYYGMTIQCYFASKSSLTNLSKGQSVTVVGVPQDTSYDTILELHDCSLVK